ncbi:MAG: XRE family transcriptional regulator [bacterium]|nr:XRE family transcriptional regulator [bacterium]
MPYEEFQRLVGKAGLSIKDFATLLGMKPNSITNYKKVGFVPTHLAVIASLISTMKDDGYDFFPIFEKVKAYEKARIESHDVS